MVAKRGWKNKLIDLLLTVMSGHVISATNDDVPLGLKLHMADIYIEEIERVSQGEVMMSHSYALPLTLITESLD